MFWGPVDGERRRLLRMGSLAGVALLLRGRWRFDVASAMEPGSTAEVHGTALGSPPSPTAPPAPLTGLTVVFFPRSDVLLDRLEGLRAKSRESLTAYRSAIPQMRRLVDSTLDGLRLVGQRAAIRSAEIDADGRFVLTEVPPGQWVLIAYRSVHVDRQGHDGVKESGTYLPQPRLVGYDRVSMWLHPLVVEPGRQAAVALTDRNVWFEGVAEQMGARELAPNTGNRRRSPR